jgi:predicted dehydrogenase
MLNHVASPPSRKDFAIGVIGAGFIVRDIQLVAYQKAGYNVVGIASDNQAQAAEVAELRGIQRCYDTVEQLLDDPGIEVVDIAVPPHVQREVIDVVLERRDHIRGIHAQKPLAMNYADARGIVERCEEAGVVLAVNQNMRYDQSVRALKHLLDRGDLGEPVLGTIEMRAIPHWQTWMRDYGKVTLLVMSIHHLDTFRYWFGNPDWVYTSARPDPRTKLEHRDGVVLYILEYDTGLRASAWDDVWAGPVREGAASDSYIKWRVEGTDGLAQGTIGWPSYPNREPSTMRFATKQHPDIWIAPQWPEVWFPDAFAGTMGGLLDALANGTEPVISGRDNLNTVALVDACYLSLDEHRPVRLDEITIKDDEESLNEARTY